jgi:hypothetical protein
MSPAQQLQEAQETQELAEIEDEKNMKIPASIIIRGV